MTESIDSLIVLGGECEQTHPRTNTAVKLYYAAHVYHSQRTPIIVSGKSGDDARAVPESWVMRDYLLTQDIPEEDVHVEDQSVDTLTNFIYSAPIIKELGVKDLGVVTEPFHVSRAVRTGRRVLGNRYRIHPVPSEGRHYTIPSFMKEKMVVLTLGWDIRRLASGDGEAFLEYVRTMHPKCGSDPQGLYAALYKLWNKFAK